VIKLAAFIVACFIVFAVAKKLWIPGYGIHVGLGYIGTPIHHAAADGDLDKVKRLIDSGTSVDKRDESGGTPLMAAINTMHFDVADYLLSKGADINATSKNGYSPFETYYQAKDPVYGPNFKIVDYMLSKGFDPHRIGYEYPIPEQEALRKD